MLSRKYYDFIKEELYTGTINGLRVNIMPKKGYSKSFATLTTKYGSNDIKFKLNNSSMKEYPLGIAHFLEHKLFEEKEGNVFEVFAESGASPNAYTNFNVTTYYFTCTEEFNKNLETLIKFVYNPYFTEENVEKEKGIIEQEIRMYDDNPNFKVYFSALEALYHNHPIKNDIAGTVESIQQISSDLLYECYNAFYTPENMVLTIVGEVNLEEVEKIITKFVPVKSQGITFEKGFYDEPHTIVEKKKHSKMGLSIPNFIIGFKDSAEGINSSTWLKRKVVMDITCRILFSRSSYIYEELYNKSLINESFSYEYTLENDYSHLIIGGESRDPEAVKALIIDTIAKSKNDLIIENEFNRIKKLLLGAYISKFNSIEALGNTLSDYFIRSLNIFDYYDVLKKVTIEDVIDRISDLFNEEKSILSVIE
jgi:Predicted Zn-dependent peptidases